MSRVTKTLKGVFSAAWQGGKLTNFLTVVVALTLAMGTPAVAANGGNFLLGRSNAASAVTTLIKSGVGPALYLVVPAGQPPLAVNAKAGKATNLNADKLDGQDSSAFLPVTGTAANADKVDGSDAPLWATVNSDGTLARSKGATGAHLHSGLRGDYVVDFEKDVSACAVTATPVDDGISSSTATSALPNSVIVVTWGVDSAGHLGPSGSKFHVVVNC